MKNATRSTRSVQKSSPRRGGKSLTPAERSELAALQRAQHNAERTAHAFDCAHTWAQGSARDAEALEARVGRVIEELIGITNTLRRTRDRRRENTAEVQLGNGYAQEQMMKAICAVDAFRAAHGLPSQHVTDDGKPVFEEVAS